MKPIFLIQLRSHLGECDVLRLLSILCTAFCVGGCSVSVTAQDQEALISNLRSELEQKQITTSDILTNSKYDNLHFNSEFRKLIRNHAPSGKASIVSTAEPGKPIVIRGQMTNGSGRPLAGQLFYFYHTMSSGYYGENDVAKLFGYIKTDASGNFEINTIKPGGYPGEKFPSHVHVEVYGENGNAIFGTEFQFYDDPRMDKETETRSLQHHNLIAKNTGTNDKPVYYYKIEVPSVAE